MSDRSNGVAKRPTDLQPRILREIARYWRQHGIPPTLRELTGPGTRSSTSALQRQVRRLEADGHLQTTRGIARSIRLTDRGWAWCGLRRQCCSSSLVKALDRVENYLDRLSNEAKPPRGIYEERAALADARVGSRAPRDDDLAADLQGHDAATLSIG